MEVTTATALFSAVIQTGPERILCRDQQGQGHAQNHGADDVHLWRDAAPDGCEDIYRQDGVGARDKERDDEIIETEGEAQEESDQDRRVNLR